jgi:hypothetical protein
MSYERSLSVLVLVGVTATLVIAAITSASVRPPRQARALERRATRPLRPDFLAYEFYDV